MSAFFVAPQFVDAWRELRLMGVRTGNVEDRCRSEAELEASLASQREAFRLRVNAADAQSAEDLKAVREATEAVPSTPSVLGCGDFETAVEVLEARFGQPTLSREAFDGLLDADRVPAVKGAPPDRSLVVPGALIESRLGRRIEEPVWARTALANVIAGSPRKLVAHEDTGTHLIRPGIGRVIYDHHGVVVGSGLVVHFDGGTGLGAPNVVCLATLDEFAGGSLESVREAKAASLLSHEFISLAPNVAAMRALSELGYDDYRFIRNNCEHFATWVTTGLRHSTQPRVRDQLERLAEKTPTSVGKNVARHVTRGVAGAADIRMKRFEWDACPSASDVPPFLLFDLARAWYSPDLQDLVAYFPAWDPDRPHSLTPSGLTDAPWRTGGLGTDAWSETEPSLSRDGHWYACLIACVEGAQGGNPGRTILAWVTSDGCWHEERFNVMAMIEARIASANDAYQKVFRSGPVSHVRARRGQSFEDDFRGRSRCRP